MNLWRPGDEFQANKCGGQQSTRQGGRVSNQTTRTNVITLQLGMNRAFFTEGNKALEQEKNLPKVT